MKKWMALLLCGLLCLCVAGAVAEEPGKLDLTYSNRFCIYPNGYLVNESTFVPYSYTNTYTVTGTSSSVDTCLDFYSKPYPSGAQAQPVTYNVVFRDVNITAGTWATAIRFGEQEGDTGANITLNLINIGHSSIVIQNTHKVFQNAGNKNVVVNIHNAPDSSLFLDGASGLAGSEKVAGFKTSVYRDGSTTVINPSSKDLTIDDCQCSNRLVEHPAVDATESKEGNIRHWVCSKCGAYFLDKEATQLTTPDKVRIPTIKRPQTSEVNSLPHTGDSSHLLRWMAVLLGACFGVIAVRSRRRV